MQTIYLDISNKGVIPTIHAKQGDVGRKFQVVLTDSGLPYIPVGGSAFSVWYSGASGEGNYTEVGDKSAFSVSGNKVTVEMISQMLSNDGEGILSLVLNDPNGNQISTWNIHYVCEYVPGAGSQEAKAYYTAFSQAVENLPYPDASLSVSGKAADAAATGKALAGKAPAGYGLGDVCAVQGWDGITKTGFYKGGVGGGMPYSSDFWHGYHIEAGVNNYAIQRANYYLFGDCTITRTRNSDGTWNPWEWENPPMSVGEEYRTTERHNGKAVYAKAINFGTLPNTNTIDVRHGLTAIEFVRYFGTMSNGDPLPRVFGNYRVELGVDSTSISVTSTADYSAYSAIISLYYTKD